MVGFGVMHDASEIASGAQEPVGAANIRAHEEAREAGGEPRRALKPHVHLHLALIQSGYGVGLLPARFIARKEFIGTVEVLRPPSFELHLAVAIVRVRHLGALERAVDLLEHGVRRLFEAGETTKPKTRRRRGVPAKRRR